MNPPETRFKLTTVAFLTYLDSIEQKHSKDGRSVFMVGGFLGAIVKTNNIEDTKLISDFVSISSHDWSTVKKRDEGYFYTYAKSFVNTRIVAPQPKTSDQSKSDGKQIAATRTSIFTPDQISIMVDRFCNFIKSMSKEDKESIWNYLDNMIKCSIKWVIHRRVKVYEKEIIKWCAEWTIDENKASKFGN